MAIGELFQSADWKNEKHVPVIECSDKVTPNEFFEVKVSIGKEVSHPNTTEHHIRWIQLFFHPEGEKFAYEIGRYEFAAHGQHVDGPNKGPVYTDHSVTAAMKTSKAGTFYASSFCNIHGLWENTKEVALA